MQLDEPVWSSLYKKAVSSDLDVREPLLWLLLEAVVGLHPPQLRLLIFCDVACNFVS